mgnify:CR=1 FL=1
MLTQGDNIGVNTETLIIYSFVSFVSLVGTTVKNIFTFMIVFNLAGVQKDFYLYIKRFLNACKIENHTKP